MMNVRPRPMQDRSIDWWVCCRFLLCVNHVRIECGPKAERFNFNLFCRDAQQTFNWKTQKLRKPPSSPSWPTTQKKNNKKVYKIALKKKTKKKLKKTNIDLMLLQSSHPLSVDWNLNNHKNGGGSDGDGGGEFSPSVRIEKKEWRKNEEVKEEQNKKRRKKNK